MTKPVQHVLNMPQIFAWLVNDGIVAKETAKVDLNHAQALWKNGPSTMQPVTAVAMKISQGTTMPYNSDLVLHG